MVALTAKEALLPMVQRGHPPAGYLTASATRKKLGNISDGMLRSYIQKGLIERAVPPGRKQGFYKREDVEKLAREIEFSWQGDTKAARSHFRQATAADIEAIADIDERIFNATEDEPEPRKTYLQWDRDTYLRWMQRNPQTFFVLTNAANKVLGFASLLPLKKETLDRFIRDEIKWMDIPNEDIDLFEPGKPLHLYIIAICVDPIYPRKVKEGYGARLISGVFDFFLDLARRGVEIATITARNELNHPDGKHLSQKLGMPQLRSPVARMHLFSIRVADSGYPLLVQYYDTLARWKQEHNS
jgi:ribosomal protein S18 acetylase RimI-like enzyme